MPPRQMPPVQRGFNLFRGPQPTQPFQSFSPFARSPVSRPARGGGLLSRLLNRSGRMGNTAFPGMTGFERPASLIGQSPVQNLASPGTLNKFLANTQQVLNTAQQIGPMIQQYGPMVRNLPAMWRLYKGFKNATAEEDADADADADTESDSPDEDSHEEAENTEKKDSAKKASSSSHQTKRSRIQKSKKASSAKAEKRSGESVPKLYI
ncbi:VrrA/YqfQ family protein [Bacillus smithii]|uniref:VrrA/YqfQ family protein n=1 Tax=Bacillus smithii TaxID=1479 RepID=UPI002E21D699|nr:VrrA/YqfQ family protein [Bacillus smithii]MED1455082.1 VrrA/YqfQ family protein [Bacillus smithii]